MPYTEIQLPTVEEVADGTTVTDANFAGAGQLDDITGTNSTFESYPDGTRYIKTTAGNTFTMRMISDADAEDAENNGIAFEFGVKANLIGSVPTDDQHRVSQIVDSGTQMIMLMRSRSATGAIQLQTNVYDRLGTAEDDGEWNQLEFGHEMRYGWGIKKGSGDGYLFQCLDGQLFSCAINTDDSEVGIGGINSFSVIDDAGIEFHITGPIKIWTDDSFEEELLAPPLDETKGHMQFWKLQIYEGPLGPFETLEGSVDFTAYTTSGTNPRRNRAINTGDTTLRMRAAQAYGVLPNANGRGCLDFPMTHLPAADNEVSFRLSAGLSRADNANIGTIRLADGVLYLDGEATEITYSNSIRYEMLLIFDEQLNKSEILLIDLTTDTSDFNRTQRHTWRRPGGIPSVDQIEIEMIGDDCEVELPIAFAARDFVGVSSWAEAPVGGSLSPEMCCPNRVTAQVDAFPRGYNANWGVQGWNPYGRSGKGITEWDGMFGENWAMLEAMRGMRIVLIEWQVNDRFNESEIVASFDSLVAKCVEYGVRLMLVTQVPFPAGGPSSYTDAERATTRRLNKYAAMKLSEQGRPDLFEVVPFAEAYGDDDVDPDIIDASSDDSHPVAAGAEAIAAAIRDDAIPVGEPGVRRPTLIERDATLLGDWKIRNGVDADTEFDGEGTISISVNTGFSQISRAILRFDRPKKLKPGMKLTKARLAIKASSGSVQQNIRIYPLIGGKFTNAGTWNDYDGENAWDAAGGDFDATTYVDAAPPASADATVVYNIAEVINKALALDPNGDTIDLLITAASEAANFSLTLYAYADDGTAPDADAPTLELAFVERISQRERAGAAGSGALGITR